MRKIIIVIAAILLLATPAMSAPQDGDEHNCREDANIIIKFSDTYGWVWYIDDTGEKSNPEGDQLPWLRLPVDNCPKCGCDPQYRYCNDD